MEEKQQDARIYLNSEDVNWSYISQLSANQVFTFKPYITIDNVIFNDPATIVFWNDGTKTVVKAHKEPYDPEKGLAMAISKKFIGSYHQFFKKWLPKEEKTPAPEPPASRYE